jgi:hypothetical protein
VDQELVRSTEDPSYLFEELEARLRKEPVVFNLVLQLAGDGDPTVDPNATWPDDRPRVRIGRRSGRQAVAWCRASAMQQGGYAGRLIHRRVTGKSEPASFRYFDKGSMAVVGKPDRHSLAHGLLLRAATSRPASLFDAIQYWLQDCPWNGAPSGNRLAA